MKSRKLTLLLSLAIAAQTVLMPFSSVGTVYAASDETVIAAEAEDSLIEVTEPDEEVTFSGDEADTEAAAEEGSEAEEELTLTDESIEVGESNDSSELTETEDLVELMDEDEAQLLADSMPVGTECDVKVLPKIYNNYNGNGYGFSFAIKTQNKANETWETVKDLQEAEIKVQVDGGSVNSFNNNKWYVGYSGMYVILKGDYLSKDLNPGEHTVKVAVERNGVWYTGTATTELVKEDIKNQTYEIHPEGSEPDPKVCFSAKAGGRITYFYNDIGSAYCTLNASGHQFKSVKLVKHGSDVAVSDGYSISSGWSGSISKNPHYKGLVYNYSDPDKQIDRELAGHMPNDDTLSLYCNFSLKKDIDEGWYDIVAVAESGAKARFTNAYYATKKTILYNIGYRLWWYYGEVINSSACPYIAAYIYGVNIDESVIPIYYHKGKAVTGDVAYKEKILADGGYAYLLNRLDPEDEIWDSGTIELDIDQIGFPEDFIDARSDYDKEKIEVNLNKTLESYTAYYYADAATLDFYGNVTFEVKELDSMKTLYSGAPVKGETVADMIPQNLRYKFDPDGFYRVIIYDEYGHVTDKEYYNRFKTGEKPEDEGPAIATSVNLDQSEIILKLGASYTLHAKVYPSDAEVKTVSWSSTDEAVVKVVPSADGLSAVVSATSSGEATICIEHADGLFAECKVTVLKDDAEENGDSKTPADDGEDHDIWITRIPDQTYTGSKITPEIRVYDGNTELVNGTDYTVSYSNNVNAGQIGAKDSKNKDIAPKAVVKFKGNYKGIELSRSFNILPLSIEENTDSDFFDAAEITFEFKTGKTYQPVPVLTRNDKKLKAGSDFEYAYLKDGKNVDKIAEAGHYEIEITGKGNYTGEIRVYCGALTKGGEYVPMSDVTVKVSPASYEYDPAGVTPSYTVTYGGKLVDEKMYTVSYLNDSNKRVGTATMIFRSSGEFDTYQFVGEKRVIFTITGADLSKVATVSGVADKPFTGDEITQDAAELTLKSDPSKKLTKDTDYTVAYSKNVGAGTATVTFNGIGAYTGSLTKKFKITKVSDADVTVDPVSDVPYAKGGAKPVPSVIYNGKSLILGKDFKVSYKNNSAVTTAKVKKMPEMTIKFKGNFTGTKTVKFNIVPRTIAALNLTISDKAYSTKANAWMSAPVITDLNGKTLKAGVDYKKLTAADYKYYGKSWGQAITPGTKITVTINGKGGYEGTLRASYYIFANDISNAKFAIADQYYTGMNISLDKEDFTTATLSVKEKGKKVTKTLVLNKDFEILYYEKNLKAGTAAVYIRGIGGEYNLGGTKKLTFNIVPKDSATSSK